MAAKRGGQKGRSPAMVQLELLPGLALPPDKPTLPEEPTWQEENEGPTASPNHLPVLPPDPGPWFVTLNQTLFGAEVPAVPVVWSNRLTRSAGVFWWRQAGRGADLTCGIRLSWPLLQARPWTDQLATLAHEMIHAWITLQLGQVRHGHGPLFQQKMRQVNQQIQTHGGKIYPAFEVTLRHSFAAEVAQQARYGWACQTCGQTYWRQRQTLDPVRHVCGRCRGPLVSIRVPGTSNQA